MSNARAIVRAVVALGVICLTLTACAVEPYPQYADGRGHHYRGHWDGDGRHGYDRYDWDHDWRRG